MSRLVWDQTGERLYETGTDRGVLYPQNASGKYPKGYAWNGLTSVSESPDGGEAEDVYADNMKYLSLMSTENFGGTIEAYTYPPEFEACDGSADIVEGVKVNQQTRKAFGFCYRSRIGNDVAGDDYGYKLHLIYNAKAQPSERQYQTVNDSPEAISFSWEFKTTPIPFSDTTLNLKPTSVILIDSTKVTAEKLTGLEKCLYGIDAEQSITAQDAFLPTPDQIVTYLKGTEADLPTPPAAG